MVHVFYKPYKTLSRMTALQFIILFTIAFSKLILYTTRITLQKHILEISQFITRITFLFGTRAGRLKIID